MATGKPDDPLMSLVVMLTDERDKCIKWTGLSPRWTRETPTGIQIRYVDPVEWQILIESVVDFQERDSRAMFEAATVAWPEIEAEFLEPLEGARLAMLDAAARYLRSDGRVDNALESITLIGQLLWRLGKRLRRLSTVEPEQVDLATNRQQSEDDSAYVSASIIMGKRFNSLATMGRQIKSDKNTTIKWRPRDKGYEVHAGDWIRHWASEDKASQQLADAEDAAEEAAKEVKAEIKAEIKDMVAYEVAQYIAEYQATGRR